MSKEMRSILVFLSITVVLLVIVTLLLNGFDLSNFQIRKGFSIN